MFRSITLAVVTLVASSVCGAQQAQAQRLQYVKTGFFLTESRTDRAAGEFVWAYEINVLDPVPTLRPLAANPDGDFVASGWHYAIMSVGFKARYPNPTIEYTNRSRYFALVSVDRNGAGNLESVGAPGEWRGVQVSPRPLYPWQAPVSFGVVLQGDKLITFTVFIVNN